jgi:flagellar biosynthesis component FlhA
VKLKKLIQCLVKFILENLIPIKINNKSYLDEVKDQHCEQESELIRKLKYESFQSVEQISDDETIKITEIPNIIETEIKISKFTTHEDEHKLCVSYSSNPSSRKKIMSLIDNALLFEPESQSCTAFYP